jgi:hypothetical protein
MRAQIFRSPGEFLAPRRGRIGSWISLPPKGCYRQGRATKIWAILGSGEICTVVFPKDHTGPNVTFLAEKARVCKMLNKPYISYPCIIYSKLTVDENSVIFCCCVRQVLKTVLRKWSGNRP